MKHVFVVALTLGALATCHAQFIYPDEFESMRMSAEQARRRDFQLKIPTFQPQVQSVNDVEGPSSGGFQESVPTAVVGQEPRTTLGLSQAPTQLPTKSSSIGFDNILPARWRDHVLNLISKGTTKFTIDMDRAIEKTRVSDHENLLFSPASLTVTLAMVLLASSGKTFEEVAHILGLESGVDISHHSEIVHQIFGLLMQESDRQQSLDPNAPSCKFAFGIFVEDGYPVREQFRAVSEKVYKSEVISVDFSGHSKEAQSIINNWVSNKTNNKIRNMLTEAPSPLTDVIITSALYFSGEWDQHFSDGNTKRKPFNIEPNETVYVDMMFNGGWFPFHEDKELGLKIVGFPYKGRDVTMYAVLPSTPGTAALKQLKSQLTADIIDGLVDKMKNSSCIIGYPKMKLSSTLKLQNALEALGLSSLFNPLTADLSVLSPGRSKANATSTPTASAPLPTAPEASKISGTSGLRQPTKTFTSDFTFPSRFGGGGGERNNVYRYESDGYLVEQWDHGYNMHKLNRAKRQSRPIDQEFIDFLNSQKLPTFGVDQLRNTAGISNPGLYADDVIHKVEMTVNERGTEAAAATSVILDRSGDYKRFIANRPFLFFIRHDVAKVIWFWGTINRPTPFYPTAA